jgi:membrane protein required for colicin V production
MENMTTLDLAIVGIVVFLGLKGFFNGLFKELFGLLGIVGGIFVGTRLGHEAGIYINNTFLHLENPSVISVTGFLGAFLLFWFGMTLLGNLLSVITSKSGLGIFDRVLGFAFAGAKVFLILAVIVHALLGIKVTKDRVLSVAGDSLALPYLQATGAYIVNADFSAIVTEAEEKTGINLDEAVESVKSSLPSADEVDQKIDDVINDVVEEKISEATTVE